MTGKRGEFCLNQSMGDDLDDTSKRGGVPGTFVYVMFARDTRMFLANPTSTGLCLPSRPCAKQIHYPLALVQSFSLLVTLDPAP